MPVGIYHGWPTPPETQASTLERSDKVTLSRAGGEHKLEMVLNLSAGYGVNAIPWFKQILKVFVCGLAEHNGQGLKSLWVNCFEICQHFRPKKSPAQKGEAFSFDAWQFRTGCTHIAERRDARERSAVSDTAKPPMNPHNSN
jgi:hypothetical protein